MSAPETMTTATSYAVITFIPILVALISGVLYLVPITNPKVTQLALYAFAASFLVVMLALAGRAVHFVSP